MHKPGLSTVFCLLALAVALTYLNSLPADFVYDDYAFICNNQEIRTLKPLSKFLLSPEAFSEPVSYHVFRPMASFTFALNYAVNGMNPVGYRLVNLIFHVINALLVFLVLRQLRFSEWPSLAGALIFAVHPAHTEAVTWISGRGNVLFLFFFLLAYLFYVAMDRVEQQRKMPLLAAAVAAYGFSLLAKEMALALPALLFAHDFFVRNERNLMKRLKMYAPFVLVAMFYVALRAHVLGRIGQVEYHGGSAYTTFLVMLQAAAVYIRLLLVPVGLSLSRHFSQPYSLLEPGIFWGLCLVVAIILGIIFLSRKAPLVSFAFFWFAAAMAPVSNVIPVNAVVADRFLYGPSIGICILFAALFDARSRMPQRYRTHSISALVCLVCLLMLLTIGRNNDWTHPHLLWSKTVKSSPTSYVALNNLALEYMKLGWIPEAVEALGHSLALRDDLPETHVNLARCYVRLGRMDEAAVHYSAALKLMDDDPAIKAEFQSIAQ
jgi:tetratricopeptide (TPR) repeat protein